jgi:hypothetical protein
MDLDRCSGLQNPGRQSASNRHPINQAVGDVPLDPWKARRPRFPQIALFGRGLGYIDLHLLAAAALNDDTRLWTCDKQLKTVAAELGLAIES